MDYTLDAMGVRFVLDGQRTVVGDVAPHVSLLQWLRASGKTGTKEGCAEGECGACAVALVERGARGRPVFEPVNACLLPLAAVDGRVVITSEGIAPPAGGLHPVQRAMVETGGSQCGYCTPGFVVSLFCEFYRPGRPPGPSGYDPEAIAGNLCRCTGYRPIVVAARSLPVPAPDDPWLDVARWSAADDVRVDEGARQMADRFFRPTSLREAIDVMAAHPDVTVLAGGTDLMVAANLRFERWSALVALDSINELKQIESTPQELTIGAAASFSHLAEYLRDRGPDIGELPLLAQLLPLFSSRLIRNRATLGGNLATASPIGDSAPVLLALDADLTIVGESGSRRIPLCDFFVGYRKTVLLPGELIAKVHVPLPSPRHQRFYKVSKRILDDISTVSAAFALTLDAAGRVEALRAAYGGIAATPLRATEVETLAAGRPWTAETVTLLLDALARVGTPLSDHRGSALYRRAMTGKLLERFFAETRDAHPPGAFVSDAVR
jgi:xanthine dehydrogenase small subunit